MREDITDTERLTFLEEKMNSHLINIGKRWYWRLGYGKPHRRADSLREAIDQAMLLSKEQNAS